MMVLNPRFLPERFFKEVAAATTRVLFLDYDGTLAPFTPDRDRAFPYPGVSLLLDRLLEMPSNRVVLISGRAIDSLKPLLGVRHSPEIWGSHGLERLLSDGTYRTTSLEKHVLDAIDRAQTRVTDLGMVNLCERKPAGLAIHTRGLGISETRDIMEKVAREWEPLAGGSGLSVHAFDGGIELRVPGIDKGFAVKTVLSEVGDDAAAAYFGDDLTDEDAFRVMRGRGMGALVRREHRETDADVWIKPPDELLHVLELWLVASGEDQ